MRGSGSFGGCGQLRGGRPLLPNPFADLAKPFAEAFPQSLSQRLSLSLTQTHHWNIPTHHHTCTWKHIYKFKSKYIYIKKKLNTLWVVLNNILQKMLNVLKTWCLFFIGLVCCLSDRGDEVSTCHFKEMCFFCIFLAYPPKCS